MSFTGTVTSSFSVAGVNFDGQASRTGDGQVSHEVSLEAGSSGTLTTRTDDNTGIATVSAGHGLIQNDKVNVFWSGGARYRMDVTNVSGNAITIDGGDGDVLPAQDTAVTLAKLAEINTDWDGDDAQIVAVVCDKAARCDFRSSAPATIKGLDLGANESWSWIADSGTTNPLTGSPVDQIDASVTGTVAGTLKVGVLYDSTP